jgi:hypothetical protein
MSDQEIPFGEADPAFEKGAAPSVIEHTKLETRTDFLPWHKPRKQWIRTEQWAATIGSLADKLELKKLQEPLRYLSLPGPDLLDIRTIRPLCAEREIELQFVGLNGGDDDKNVALSRALESQVRDLPGIHPASEVVKDKFEHLGVEKSVAHAKVITSQRSFDVINVDLCGSFAESLPDSNHATIPNALYSLIQHQAKSRSRDWLLFITTRSDARAVKREVMEKFVDWLNGELVGKPEMKKNFIELGLLIEEDFHENIIDLNKLSPQSHSNAFNVAFGHWVLQGLAERTPAWRADMLPQVEYHVVMKDSPCDMVSLGFWCRQLKEGIPSDKFGIAKKQVQPAANIDAVIESCANKINRRVSEKIDLDLSLQLNPQYYEAALESSAKLLVDAMYDEKAYRSWAEKERRKMENFLGLVGLI